MSVNTIERIFWELGAEPDRANAYLQDSRAYLEQYPLTAEEARMVLSMDVRALDACGVNPMLTMAAYTMARGGGDLLMFEYLKELNGGRMLNRMRLPGWQFNGLRLALGARNAWIGLLRLLGFKKHVY